MPKPIRQRQDEGSIAFGERRAGRVSALGANVRRLNELVVLIRHVDQVRLGVASRAIAFHVDSVQSLHGIGEPPSPIVSGYVRN